MDREPLQTLLLENQLKLNVSSPLSHYNLKIRAGKATDGAISKHSMNVLLCNLILSEGVITAVSSHSVSATV